MLKFALFGAGRIGNMHAECMAKNTDVELVYVYDTNSEAAEALAKRFRATPVSNIDVPLFDSAIDAVLIASASNTHVQLLQAASKAGKSVLCEKPIGVNLAEVDECRTRIAGAGGVIHIGFNRRFDPNHGAVGAAVQKGEIGKPELLVITSRDPDLSSVEYHKASGGIFLDMTIHDLDLARFILREDPIELYATGSVMVDPMIGRIGDFDTAMVVMTMASGALVHVNNSRRSVYGYDQRIEAFGSSGMVQSQNVRPSTLERYNSNMTAGRDRLLYSFIERYTEAFGRQLAVFVSAVRGERSAVVSFEDGRRAQILANLALESAKTGRVVKVGYS
jgi:myo-inositol 2-dehydrogenase / D-chiro-inositol 1-dehydrogenase